MTLYRGKYRIEPTRLHDWDYRSRGWYFVTLCTAQRKCFFGTVVDNAVVLTEFGRIAESGLQTLYQHYDDVRVDEYVVMPNHVHAIVAIEGAHAFSPSQSNPKIHRSMFSSPQAGSLSAILRSYKAGVTLRCRELGLNQVVWQSRFHDHLLRGNRVISAVREYIRNNPANWHEDRENPFQRAQSAGM
jgi:REP element-mobilizing transposase RayT